MTFAVHFRGLQNALFDLIENPGLLHALMEKGTAVAVARGKYWLDHGIRILRLNDSVGNMSVMSPAHWREIVFPHLRDVVTELHAYSPDARVYCHICGNILPIAADLVTAGLDCIAPLDPLGGMSVAQVRGAVGPEMPLMGGVDTQLLANGAPKDIRAAADACMAAAGPHFALGSGCVVPCTAPKENLLALVEAARSRSRSCLH